MKGRNVIVRSFCSKVFGLYIVKVWHGLRLRGAGIEGTLPLTAPLPPRALHQARACVPSPRVGFMTGFAYTVAGAAGGVAGHHWWCGIHGPKRLEDPRRVPRPPGRRPWDRWVRAVSCVHLLRRVACSDCAALL
jgi:hypothetical protein